MLKPLLFISFFIFTVSCNNSRIFRLSGKNACSAEAPLADFNLNSEEKQELSELQSFPANANYVSENFLISIVSTTNQGDEVLFSFSESKLSESFDEISLACVNGFSEKPASGSISFKVPTNYNGTKLQVHNIEYAYDTEADKFYSPTAAIEAGNNPANQYVFFQSLGLNVKLFKSVGDNSTPPKKLFIRAIDGNGSLQLRLELIKK